LHGADTRQRADAETREVHCDLRDLYDLRGRLDSHVQGLFHDELATHYGRPTWFLRNWIAIHEPLIRDNLRQVTERAKAGVRSIRQYMVSITS
jgi:hypothetical protein